MTFPKGWSNQTDQGKVTDWGDHQPGFKTLPLSLQVSAALVVELCVGICVCLAHGQLQAVSAVPHAVGMWQ